MRDEMLKKIQAFLKNAKDGNPKELLEELQAKFEYISTKLTIVEEILTEKTGQKKLHLSESQKRRLAQAGRKLNTVILSEIEDSFAPKTILNWYNTLVGDKYNSVAEGQAKRGRKVIIDELRDEILKLAEENPTWGYRHIADYLVYLGYEITFMTVKRIMNNYGYFPSDKRKQNSKWQTFLNAHKDVIAACDFATYELVTPSGLKREHILFFEDITTREVWCGGIRHNPDGEYMAQIARNQTDCDEGKLCNYRYLIHDRDTLFTDQFTSILETVGCKSKKTPPRTPEANGHIESFIKTFKAECLNHLVLTSEEQLRYVVREFLIYYNRERPHSGLGGKFINPWPQVKNGRIQKFERLGGLLTSYRRVA